MRKKIRKEIMHLLAFIIGMIGMTSMVCLTAAVVYHHLSFGWYIVWMFIAGLVLQSDSRYIERHFINGEWV